MQFKTLPGFREFYPEECLQRNHLFSVWRSVARSFGFAEYDAPILEPLELYIEKSGEEIVGQLFNFEDRGGRAVALRPEMTPSLARLVGARANGLKRPVRWFNIGEHYRYERPQKGRLRAFYQFNADILGIEGAAADAELIALMVQSLRRLGLSSEDFRVRLSDRLLWKVILEAAGLEGASASAVLGVVDKMERLPREKTLELLTPHLAEPDAWLTRIEAMMAQVDSVEALKAFLDELHPSLSPDGQTLAAARLAEWQVLLRELKMLGVGDFIRIDLGIVRGLAYYTGFVFEAFETSGDSRALAGGGRYDDLVAKLGGPGMPAVGFAMGDVTVFDLLKSKERLPPCFQKPDVAILVEGETGRGSALQLATVLREQGCSVEVPLKAQSMNKQLKAAQQKGAAVAVCFYPELAEGAEVRVRHFADRTERTLALDEAASLVLATLDQAAFPDEL